MNDRFTDDPYADREALASLLEQAERERDEARQQTNAALVAANHALAKVPALVEAGERMRHKIGLGYITARDATLWDDALAAWEQE